MTVPARTVIGSVSTTVIIPPMLALSIKTVEETQGEETDAGKQSKIK